MTYVQTYLVGWVGQRALADLRIRIFTHLQTLPIGFYESRPAGVLISRMTNDVEALDSLVTDSVVTLFQSGLTLLGTVVILLYLDVQPGADHVLRVPAAGRRARCGSASSRPAPSGARARRSARSRPICRRRCRASASCAASARSPSTRRSFAELNEDNRDANMATVRLNAPTSRPSKCSPGWRSR